MIDEGRSRNAGGELARFTRDLTAEARAGKLDPVRCRDDEVSRLIDILLRHGKNNPVLVGPAGVGKTAIVDGFAQRIAFGTVPFVLRDVRVLSLDHVALLAGTTYRGQYEERIRVIVAETTAAPDIILFIDELHNLIGQGTAMGAAMDAANMLKPSLVRGDFRVIGATTDEEYDRWIGGDPALERRFQKVTVKELGVPETLAIIRARKERLERHHNVVITDESIEASVALTDRYVTDRRRPDKAIDALDEACAHTQAVSKYSARAETLMRDRVRRLREPIVGGRESNGGGAGGRAAEDAQWERMARDGMTALERFGAEIEKMFAAPIDAPPPPAAHPPRPEPMTPEPISSLGEIETELSHVLSAEGIVVRGHDVARVVSLMCGQTVTWGS
ncbi:MAG TPA: AAA family ATPase [Gemmatimonadaceae bacterium]|nr:AAA family ATPase [Gemmatimonadaceae bacterium]